jgi:hypothetical protein
MPNPLGRRLRRRWLPQALSVVLVAAQLPAAQQAAAPPQAAPAQSSPAQAAPQVATPPAAAPAAGQPIPASQLPVEQNLKILVLAGNNEMNDLQRNVMAPLVVQVLDQDDRPMDGAQVVFRFPITGPGAAFAGNKAAATVRTNSGGQAAATNWMANGQVGTFDVHVTASYGNQIGETTLKMSNVTRIEEVKKPSKGKSLWSHTWFKVAVIGGAALAVGLGVYFGTRGGGKSGTTVGVSPGGPVTVSGP